MGHQQGKSKKYDEIGFDSDDDLCNVQCSGDSVCGATPRPKGGSANRTSQRRCTAVRALLDSAHAGLVCAFEDQCMGACIWVVGEPERTLAVRAPPNTGTTRCLNFDSCTVGSHRQAGVPVYFCQGSDTGQVTEWELDAEWGVLQAGRTWHAHEPAPNEGARYSGVASVAMDGQSVVTGGSDSSACIWSCSGHNEVSVERRLDGVHGGAVTAVSVGSPITRGVTAGQDGIVRLWSPSGDMSLPPHGRERCAPSTGVINEIMMDTKHHRLCTGSSDGLVRLWDIAFGRATRRFLHRPFVSEACAPGQPPWKSERNADVGSVNTMQDAMTVVSAGEMAAPVRLGVHSVDFDTEENPTQLASGGRDGSWHLWDIRVPSPAVTKGTAHEKAIHSLALQGCRLVTASRCGTAALWDLRNISSAMEWSKFLGLRPIVQQVSSAREWQKAVVVRNDAPSAADEASSLRCGVMGSFSCGPSVCREVSELPADGPIHARTDSRSFPIELCTDNTLDGDHGVTVVRVQTPR